MARAMRKYVYQTSSKGKCGCKNFSWWHVIEASSKAEIIRKYKTNYNTVDIMTADEMKALMAKHPGTVFKILGEL